MIAKRAVAGNIARVVDLDQLARFKLADEIGADDIERDAFAGEHHRPRPTFVRDATHDQRPDAQRIAAGDHALRGHADQRIGPFDQPQSIDELVKQGRIAAGGDEVDDDLGVAGRLEDRTLADQIGLKVHGVGNIAIMRDRKAAGSQVGE